MNKRTSGRPVIFAIMVALSLLLGSCTPPKLPAKWQQRWQQAPRDKRQIVAERIVNDGVLIGLSWQECLEALGAPDDFYWYEGEWSHEPGSYYYHVLFIHGLADLSTGSPGMPVVNLDQGAQGRLEQNSGRRAGGTGASAPPSPRLLTDLAESGRAVPDWVLAWEKAGRAERCTLAERMYDEKPLKGLSPAECIRVLGAPRSATWYCGQTAFVLSPWGRNWDLEVLFNEKGFIDKVGLYWSIP